MMKRLSGFFSTLDFFSRCVTTWYCQGKVSVIIQTQAVSESVSKKGKSRVAWSGERHRVLYLVFVRLKRVLQSYSSSRTLL